MSGTGQHFMWPKVKVKGQIMYFLVDASPPKQLDVHISHDVEVAG